MCCLGHNENTINKSVWYKDNHKIKIDEYKSHIELLSTLNIYESSTVSS